MRLFDDFCVANGDASVPELWLPEMAAVSRRHVVAGDPTTHQLAAIRRELGRGSYWHRRIYPQRLPRRHVQCS